MPVDEDYGHRQLSQQQQQQQQQRSVAASAAPPQPLHCPVGCSLAPLQPQPTNDRRYASEKNLLVDATAAVGERYADRFVPERHSSDRLPSGERYPGASERYPLGDRPASSERLIKTPTPQQERYQYQRLAERCAPVGSLDRYHPAQAQQDRWSRTSTPTDRYHTMSAADKERCLDRYNGEGYNKGCNARERSTSSDRKGYHYQRYPLAEHYPPIPCPERFASQDRQERMPFGQQYGEPPSPAPANDRFIPPPPLSPESTPSPDCFPANAFPSPTTAVPPPERFIPPPPLSPSPTEAFSPKKQRYHDHRYAPSPGPGDRYRQETSTKPLYYPYAPPYAPAAHLSNPHMPVERYVPQEYYYPYYPAKYPPGSDPYMRRDLTFRPTYATYRARLPGRKQCCVGGYQAGGYRSPGSSSGSESSRDGQCKEGQVTSSTATTHQELQCQGYPSAYQQERGTQCGNAQCYPRKCKHVCASPGVEYVGASGGRHVCATPPPPKAESVACCQESCRRTQSALAVAVWRASSQPPTPPQQSHPTPPPTHTTRPHTPVNPLHAAPTPPEPPPSSQPSPPRPSPPQTATAETVATVRRVVSLPPPVAPAVAATKGRGVTHTRSERRDRVGGPPRLERSMSRREMVKEYIKRETASFFGVDEDTEAEQQVRWLERRKRMASRAYGPLKDEYRQSTLGHRRTLSELTPSGRSHAVSGQLQTERPDVLPGSSDVLDAIPDHDPAVALRRKDSVARMTWDGLAYVVTTLTRHRPRPRSQLSRFSRSYPPDTPSLPDSTAPTEERAFFSCAAPVQASPERTPPPDYDQGDSGSDVVLRRHGGPAGGWRRDPRRHDQGGMQVGGGRIYSTLLDGVLDNSDRREWGSGWIGRVFGHSFRKSVMQDEKVREQMDQQLDDMEDHRPMFTYWVTTVQILVLIISLICYGFGPFGVDLQSRSGQVLVTSLSLQQVDYMEPANFWLGPRASDLIHLGAKFAPCMRVDNKITQEIDKIRLKERETACCIRNDDSGCVQSSKSDCSQLISTWKKWKDGTGPGGRISGSVCGLDPKFCDAPASVHPYEWPDDITKWPICRKTNTQFSMQKGQTTRDKQAEHMVCEVIGHPCCIGIHGQCKITTKEYCDFVRGAFHEEASLCSQVSCLNDVCGMLPFYFPETPDQFYRLWTSLFLHAGVLQLTVTILIQYLLMRDLEKLTGSLRIGIIYIGSGVAGNLASAIFVPYRADVGPSGSQFGLLACLIVEVLNSWPMLKHPNQALCKLLSITLALFLIGLLPWVDNYAHLFGFVFGFLLSYALLPFISFGTYDRYKKVVLIWVCLLSAGFLFICLVLLFYIIPVYDCKVCSYFNCIPFTRNFCASQNINFKRENV